MEMTENGFLEPEKVTPLDSAAYYHGLKVHLQKFLDSKKIQLDPRERDDLKILISTMTLRDFLVNIYDFL